MPKEDVLSSDTSVDSMAVVLKHYDCEVIDPAVLGLTEELGAKVIGAVRGEDCAPIRILPNPNCKQEIAPALSQLQFEGTVVFLKSGGYQLIDGKGVYKAVRDACGHLPNVEVSALGIKMEPTMDFEFYSRLEKGANGKILIRFHMFEGEGRVTSEMHGSYIMKKDLQIVVDPQTFQVVDRKSFAQNEPEMPQTTANLAVPDAGCNTSATPHHIPDGLTTILLTTATLAALSAKTRKSLSSALSKKKK